MSFNLPYNFKIGESPFDTEMRPNPVFFFDMFAY